MNGWTVCYSTGVVPIVQLGHRQEYDEGYYLWHPVLGGRVRYETPFSTVQEAEAWNTERLESRAGLTIADVEAAYVRTRDEGLHNHLRTD